MKRGGGATPTCARGVLVLPRSARYAKACSTNSFSLARTHTHSLSLSHTHILWSLGVGIWGWSLGFGVWGLEVGVSGFQVLESLELEYSEVMLRAEAGFET